VAALLTIIYIAAKTYWELLEPKYGIKSIFRDAHNTGRSDAASK
jgi:hypothetical protein